MTDERPNPALPMWSLPLFGALAVLAGLAPWFATGARLPLQNLWEQETLPADMPLVAVPLSQYELGTVLAMFVVGGVLAGLVVRTSTSGAEQARPVDRSNRANRADRLEHARRTGDAPYATGATPSRIRGRAAWAAGIGAGIVLAAVIIQSALVVAGGLREGPLAGSYLALAVAWSVLCALVALTLLGLIARAPRPGATIGWAVAAAPIATWVGLWLRPALVGYSDGPSSPLGLAITALRWLPAIVLGVALAWCGLRRRVSTTVAWLVSLAVLWIMPAALTGLTYIAGYRRPGDAWELLSSGLQVFGMALAPNLAGPPVLLALAIGLVGAAGVAVARRARRRSAAPDPDAPAPAGVAGWQHDNERNVR